jgi:hypothetical protein
MARTGPALSGRDAVTDPLPDLAADPDALRVSKNPFPVQVEFAAGDGVCETLEGAVRYRAGDAILTGIKGERWPVKRGTFLSTYEPAPPTRAGESGTYRKAPAVTYARRVDRACDVPVNWQDSSLHARPGDWLLQYADGSYCVVQDDIFRASYAAASGEGRWPPPE